MRDAKEAAKLVAKESAATDGGGEGGDGGEGGKGGCTADQLVIDAKATPKAATKPKAAAIKATATKAEKAPKRPARDSESSSDPDEDDVVKAAPVHAHAHFGEGQVIAEFAVGNDAAEERASTDAAGAADVDDDDDDDDVPIESFGNARNSLWAGCHHGRLNNWTSLFELQKHICATHVPPNQPLTTHPPLNHRPPTTNLDLHRY